MNALSQLSGERPSRSSRTESLHGGLPLACNLTGSDIRSPIVRGLPGGGLDASLIAIRGERIP